MTISPKQFPELITAIINTINAHEEEVTELDQAIGDGDHVFNLQRGLTALEQAQQEISALAWPAAWQKIGMVLMASVGGASGSLYATLFINLSKNSGQGELSSASFAHAFSAAVDAVKQRGKAEAGEKTMLDVLIPVAAALKTGVDANLDSEQLLKSVTTAATEGVESTRNMIATKGRASFLGERSIGHIDAGAKTAQLMIEAITSL